jgi:hypothetical protein
MNAKNAAPLLATLPAIAAPMPQLIIVGAGCYLGYRALKWVHENNGLAEFLGMADDDKEHRRNEVASTPTSRAPMSDTPPAPAAPPRPSCPALVIPPVSGENPAQNHSIPQNSGGKPNAPSTPSAPSIPSAPAPVPRAPSVSASMQSVIPAMKIAVQAPLPPPIKKKFVTREDLATIFQRGARALTRTAAVAALKNLGFEH